MQYFREMIQNPAAGHFDHSRPGQVIVRKETKTREKVIQRVPTQGVPTHGYNVIKSHSARGKAVGLCGSRLVSARVRGCEGAGTYAGNVI